MGVTAIGDLRLGAVDMDELSLFRRNLFIGETREEYIVEKTVATREMLQVSHESLDGEIASDRLR